MWGLLKLAIWFGIMVALCTVVIVVALAAVLGAVVFGLASPTRSPASSLRLLAANTRAAVALVAAQGQNKGKL